MVKENKVVIGSYSTPEEAAAAVSRLKEEGYRQEDITLYTNEENLERLRTTQDVKVEETSTDIDGTTDTQEDDRSFWDKVKDAFSTDSYDYETTAQDPSYRQEDDMLYPYREEIKEGHIAIAVENYREGTSIDTPTGSMSVETNRTETTVKEPSSTDNQIEDEKIRLKEDRLEIDKEEVQTGEVNVRKETKHETETVDVPVEREEIVIERKPVEGKETETKDTTIGEETESFKIPVKEEQVEVSKKPVVKEEVEIKKERKEDVEKISEDVRREELDIDTKGRTGVDQSDKNLNRDNKNKR